MEKIEQDLQKIVRANFDIDVSPKVKISEREGIDYTTNIAMQIASQLGESPRKVADEIASELNYKTEVAGPGFINITFSGKDLSGQLISSWSENYGNNNDGVGKIALVEYPSPNIAKPYSVGHLRPGNQGWAARNLMQATGWKVITDNHIGDYGAPFGIWVVGFKRFSDDTRLAASGVYELGRIYIAMREELREEEKRGETELADEVQTWLLRLENNDAEAIDYFEKFSKISLDHIHEVMARLGISTDHELGEAFFAEAGKAEAQKLLEQGIAEKNDDGSVIVRLNEFGIDVPILLQKSNGAALYATTDLATLIYREKEWHPDRVIYAVAAEQKFYFEQLFALARKIGIKTELIHLWFGMIDQLNEDGTRSKMSSRQGVVLMEELLNQAEAKVKSDFGNNTISDDDVSKIALGAIKFTDFSRDRRTNILFDWDTMFSLTGFSGPYVQYAAVRINKILREHGGGALSQNYDYEAEREIIKKLLEYPEVVRTAANLLEPHRIAQYVYELARTMNRYYESTPIATDVVELDIKNARLDLLKKVAQVFAHGLNILGIEIPEQM